MVLPLSTLTRNAFGSFRTLLQPAAVIALLAAVLVMFIQLSASAKVDRVLEGGMESLGMDQQRMEELGRRMEAGDEAAMEEIMQELEAMGGRLEGMSDEERSAFFQAEGKRMFLRAAPFMLGSMTLLAVVSLLACCGYLILAVDGFKGWNAFAARLRNALLPLLGVWLWAFLRSFAWIPFVGPFIALFLGPRFALSSVIYLQEKGTIAGAVTSSYQRSNGYWGKILGNMVAVGLCLAVLSWILVPVIGMFSRSLPALGFLVSGFLHQLGIAFYTVFLVHLSRTVLENRLVPKK